MNRSEILNFFKAPFKERFLLACALCLPILLATPLVFSFFEFIYTHIGALQSIDSEEKIGNVVYSWFITQDALLPISAILGGVLTVILSSGFLYMLGHSIVEQRGNIFDFKPVSLTSEQIVTGALKTISFFFWGFAYGFLCGVVLIFLPVSMLFFGHYVPSLFAVLLWIVIVLFEIALILWMILNTWVSGFRFLVHLKTRVFFQFRENYLYLKQYKGRFFLAGVLCVVCGMIIQILLQNFYSWIITAGSFLEGALLALNVPQPNVVIVLGLLVAIGITMYLSLLQMTFTAKSIVWLEQKQPEGQAENIVHNPTKAVTHKAPTKTVARRTKAVANRKRK